MKNKTTTADDHNTRLMNLFDSNATNCDECYDRFDDENDEWDPDTHTLTQRLKHCCDNCKCEFTALANDDAQYMANTAVLNKNDCVRFTGSLPAKNA